MRLSIAVVVLLAAGTLAGCSDSGSKEGHRSLDSRGGTESGSTSSSATEDAGPASRQALVIGNSDYGGALRLANPGHDADVVGKALEDLGFTVIKKKDLDKKGMDDALIEFCDKLTKGSVALFYYAGHGVQVKGENFLVPVKARIRKEFEVADESLSLAKVLRAMEERGRLKIVVLDCCRDNPLARAWQRSAGNKGLAAVGEVPQGTLIAFSTAAGDTAEDGSGENSPYAAHLARVLQSRPQQGLELVEAFRTASRAVKEDSGQTPWLHLDASLPEFHLWKPEPVKPTSPQPTGTPITGSLNAPAGNKATAPAADACAVEGWCTKHGVPEEICAQCNAKVACEYQKKGDWCKEHNRPESQCFLCNPNLETKFIADYEAKYGRKPPKPEGKKEFTNSLGMKMVLIPAGEFMMGTPESQRDRPNIEMQHRVRITKPFYLGATHVTRGQFRQFVEAEDYRTEAEKDGKGAWVYDGEKDIYEQRLGYTWRNTGFEQTDNHPVVNVSWNDATAFCEWLSRKEGKKYRLPAEAQWEYACRAGTTTRFHFGSTLNGREANCKGSYPYGTEEKGPFLKRTTEVGSYPPNAFGLYDMHGNALQWCADWYEEKYYENSPIDDPTGPSSGSRRVTRGGGWAMIPSTCHAAFRNGNKPGDRGSIDSFRVSLVAE